VAILVDEPIWWFKGRRWCHMVSDTSLDELHRFAEQLGVPPQGFQGDHYDIPDEMRLIALEEGAIAVTSRELVTALYAAGLRARPGRAQSVMLLN